MQALLEILQELQEIMLMQVEKADLLIELVSNATILITIGIGIVAGAVIGLAFVSQWKPGA